MITQPATEEIRTLFEQYEKYVAELNFSAIAKLYDKYIVLAGPTGTFFRRNNFVTRYLFAASMKSFYRKAKATSKLISLEESPVSTEFSMVKVHWGSTFAKTGDRVIEYDGSYLVQKSPELKIILFIAHEDENVTLQKLGIIT
ncbi:MAG TPA: hypothetical protein VK826_11715 [Bacteroidia bacterium]|nr:hypothetical protein [Bacteroidia bacterium]